MGLPVAVGVFGGISLGWASLNGLNGNWFWDIGHYGIIIMAIIGFVIFALGCRYADSGRYNRDSEWLAETKRLQDIVDEVELQRFNRV